MAPLFKVLNALARNYKLNLIKNQLVESVFAPLLQLDQPKYVKLPIGDVSMYLEFLATLSTLSDEKIFETKPDIFHEPNVHFLVAMAIKHGSVGKNGFLFYFIQFPSAVLNVAHSRSVQFGLVVSQSILIHKNRWGKIRLHIIKCK